MAKVDPQSRLLRGNNGSVAETVTWGPISPGDEIGWYDLANSEVGKCQSAQVEGDFHGATCSIQGSNSGNSGWLLHNSLGMEAIISGNTIIGIDGPTRYIRPAIDGGDKDTKITVTTYGRG